MKLTAQIKLLPTPAQADALKRTLAVANAACTAISRVAFAEQTFGKYALQERLYYAIREQFGLSAQLTIRCLAKVADSYKLDRATLRTYRPLGSVAFDDRILAYDLPRQTISIWTVDGRQPVPFVAGDRQLRLLYDRHGESDLVCRKGTWYLLATCVVDPPEAEATDQALGVDLGMRNLATDSDGVVYSGTAVERVRRRSQTRRDRLQRVGTKSAKRRMKKNSGRQRRFQTNENHRIAKQLVETAKRTHRALTLEDLTGIRARTEPRVRKSQRSAHSNWAFAQLRAFVVYKAARAGVAVVFVDPRNTSRTCSQCGHCEKANRVDQAQFRCRRCGYAAPADYNAACTIRDRVHVSGPMASGREA